MAAAGGAAKALTQKAIGGEHFDVSEEGARSGLAGGLDGALTAVTGGLAKGLQVSLYKAIGLKSTELAAELSAGTLRATDLSLSNKVDAQPGKRKCPAMGRGFAPTSGCASPDKYECLKAPSLVSGGNLIGEGVGIRWALHILSSLFAGRWLSK